MILDTTSKVLRIVLGEAQTTNPCQIVASWAEVPTTFLGGNTNTNSNGTTPVIVVASPSSGSVQRDVREVRVFNADTVTHTVTLQLYDGANAWIIAPGVVSILAGGSFVYTPQTGPGGAGAPPPTLISANQPTGTVSLANNTATNVINISLPAGTYLVYGNVQFGDNTTTYSSLDAWLSSASATFPTRPNAGGIQNLALSFTTGNQQTLSAGTQVITVASITTYYLTGLATYSGGTPTVGGFIGAIPL